MASTLREPSKRTRCIFSTAVSLAIFVLAALPSSAAASKNCGSYRDPDFGRIVVTVTKGKVTCTKARALIKRSASGRGGGEPTGAGNTVRYRDGWYCGGQMGRITCSKPFKNPRYEVVGENR